MACQICNNKSGIYPLCPACFKLRDEGKVIKDEASGTWKLVKKETKVAKPEKQTQIFGTTACLICNDESNDKLFCTKCYHKYKDKSVILKVTNCQDVELLSDEYEGNITCSDGHVVKSKSEKFIDDYLYNKKILHVYEKALYYDNDKNPIKVDFYLPEEEIYIDHLGFDGNKKYDEKTKFNFEIYKKFNLTVICTTEKDMQDIESILNFRLNKNNYKKGKINFFNNNNNNNDNNFKLPF